MSRILFFLGIFIVIAVAWSISRRRSELTIKERDELEELRRTQKGRTPAAVGEPMERLAHTAGRIFPKRDAVHRGGKSYCSAECRVQTNRERRHFQSRRRDRLKGVPSSPLYSSSFHPSPYWDERPQLTKSGAAGDPVDLIVLHFISLPAGTFGGDAVDRLFMGTLNPIAEIGLKILLGSP